MMKQNITLLLLMIFGMLSCKKQELKIFSDSHYYGFSSTLLDTINHSFFFYIEDVVPVQMPITLTGKPFDQDIKYRIMVVDSSTTCPDYIYQIEKEYTLIKGAIADTIAIVVTNNNELRDTSYALTIDLVSNEQLQSRGGTSGRRVIMISDIASKPAWWVDDPIGWNYLGVYSRKKYELFMEVTGESNLEGMSMGEIRILTLKFQHWLDNQNPKILEEDGSIMKTEIIG